MRKDWHIRSPWDDVILVPKWSASEGERGKALPPGQALQRLRGRFPLSSGTDAMARQVLAEIVKEIDPASVHLLRTSTGGLQDRVERALSDGRLIAVFRKRPLHGGGADPVEGKGGPAQEQPPGTEPEKTWIEFELLDYENLPLAGHPYRLELPDGSVREGTTNQDGLARVSGIDPGTCQLTWMRQPVTAYHPEKHGAPEPAGQAA